MDAIKAQMQDMDDQELVELRQSMEKMIRAAKPPTVSKQQQLLTTLRTLVIVKKILSGAHGAPEQTLLRKRSLARSCAPSGMAE